MNPDKEIKPLTGLRGIAALYVVIFHFFIGQRFTNPVTTLLAHGYLAVDVFFVLSGFVMTLTYSHLFDRGHSLVSYATFLGRRIARIYPLYLAGTLCALVLIRAGILEPPHLRMSGALLSNLFMVQAWGITESLDGPGWSISTEWAAYLLFPMFLLCLMKNRFGRGLALTLSLGALAFLATNPAAHAHAVDPGALLDVHDWRHGLPVLRCLAEFVLGMLSYRFTTAPMGMRFALKAWAQNTLAVATIVLLMLPRTDMFIVCMIPPLLAGVASGRSLVAHWLSSKPLETAGRYSYSIYMIHTLLYGVLGWIHAQINALGLPHGQTYAAAVGIALTIPLAALAYRFIEKPGRTIIRDLLEEKSSAAPTSITVPPLSPIGLDPKI
jgi:peptidoglycan/LPS O-acetylase OafA/YrhL